MKIYPHYFFLAFAVGILYTYITLPMKDLIIKNPTPDEVAKIIDKDNCKKNNTCYRYKIKPNLA